MMSFLFIFLFNAFSMSFEDIKCTKTQSLVDYHDPFNHNRIVYCQENIDGKLTQVGPRFEFSPEGKLISGGSAKAQAEVAQPSGESVDEDVKSIDQLFSIFMPHSKRRHSSDFKTSDCRVSKAKMVELVLFNKPFNQSFKFSEKCDLEGSLNVRLGEAFPIAFKIRNLDGYEKVEFDLLLKFIKESLGVKVEFIGTKGVLKKASKEVRFSGNYYYLMNLSKKTNQGQENIGGEILVESINQKTINLKKKVYFD